MASTAQVHFILRILLKHQVRPGPDNFGVSVDQSLVEPTAQYALCRAQADKLEGLWEVLLGRNVVFRRCWCEMTVM